jgi:PAS domain-containing protein
VPQSFYGAAPESLWGENNGRWLREMDRLAMLSDRVLCHAEDLEFEESLQTIDDVPVREKQEPYRVSLRIPIRGEDGVSHFVGVLGFGFDNPKPALTAAATFGIIASDVGAVDEIPAKEFKTGCVPDEIRHLAIHLERFLNRIPSEVCIKDEKSRVIWCNARFARFIGRNPKRTIGCRTDEIWGRDRAAMLEAIDVRVLGGKVVVYDDPIKRPDNHLRARFGIRFPVKFGERTLVGSLGFDTMSPSTAKLISTAFSTKAAWHRFYRPRRWFLSHAESDAGFFRKYSFIITVLVCFQ